MRGNFKQELVDHSEFLKPFAITLTRDQEEAKDLFQETLYRALANVDKYNGGTNVKAWLYTIMRNIFINNYRRKARHRTIHFTAAEDLGNAQPVSTDHPENRIEVKNIFRLVHRLPEIFRYPFLLYFDGYRYHEISEIMKEPLGTIKSRIHFARKFLKSEIERF
jgi:RNA polymerase sigma-70 factor (ECF subfamily)